MLKASNWRAYLIIPCWGSRHSGTQGWHQRIELGKSWQVQRTWSGLVIDRMRQMLRQVICTGIQRHWSAQMPGSTGVLLQDGGWDINELVYIHCDFEIREIQQIRSWFFSCWSMDLLLQDRQGRPGVIPHNIDNHFGRHWLGAKRSKGLGDDVRPTSHLQKQVFQSSIFWEKTNWAMKS